MQNTKMLQKVLQNFKTLQKLVYEYEYEYEWCLLF